MNRFDLRSRRRPSYAFVLAALLFAAVLLLTFWGFHSVSNTTEEKEIEGLTQALNRDIVHCYATEGYYPPSLSYVQEHYGLRWDESRYYIDYQPIGSNLFPDVTILRKGGGS